MNVIEKAEHYLCKTYRRSLSLSEGLGSEIWDEDGKKYIDFASGIAVNIFGVSDSEWADSVSRQAYMLSHTSNLYYNSPSAELAEMLCVRTGMKRVFLCNSGLEANECAIKSARKYSFDRYGEGRFEVISLNQSFHGRSLATLAATGQSLLQESFLPMPKGFGYVDANDIDALNRAVTEHTAAVMIELIQGESGVNPLDKDYVKAVEELCRARDLLLIVDEVQTGMGRTGTLFSYEQYDIAPDIVTAAKGLGGGLPIGAVLFSERTADVLVPGSHGSTFGGNPIVAAGACNILARVNDDVLQSVKEKGARIREVLKNLPKVKSVSGLGLMLGIEIEGDALEAVRVAEEKGLLIITAKKKLRLLPALNIPEELLESGLEILKEILQ